MKSSWIGGFTGVADNIAPTTASSFVRCKYLWGTITHRRHDGDVVNGKAGATTCLECNSRVAAAGAESVGPTASSLCVCKGHMLFFLFFF